ncbi:hypothetical protein EDB81DRAFT_759322 [Dactylonectria macrodidyma]|uniref:C2H2-type domain-containing protein n=1 Tax=Dactylonectria macrodidyma TaxID=307937 RepID=A0A9P9EWN1_9HYPO|nr:hypothetical protein EDB81DRAFT_759322 [Dactylonectria macrodidyma]
MAQTSLDLRSGDATPIEALMGYPSFQSLHPISQNLLNAPFSKLNVETTRVPPSPSIESGDSDSVIGETIVCAPFPNDTTEQDWHRNAMPATRSISFDEVFQGGKVPVNQIIIQFPNSDGSWFILRCDEHDHDFMYPPLRGAAAHLRSKKHGWLRNPSNAVIVEHFGIEVLNCNAELAEKNNSISFKVGQGSMKRSISRIADGMPRRRTSGSEKRPKFTTKGCSQTGVDRHGGLKRQSKQRRHEGISSRPNLSGILGNDERLVARASSTSHRPRGIRDYIPECYDYDPETKDLKWKKGYEHGGPRVMEREFPVLYFDGNKFPDGSPADWVRAGDLQDLDVFDASPRLVPNLKIAKNYLRRRIEKEADAASESATALLENSGTTSSSCVAGSGSPITSALGGMVPLMGELATEPIFREREVSSFPSMESEISRPDSQLEHANRNCCGNALEPELGSVPDAEQTTSFDTRSQMAVPEVNYRTTIEDEANYETESSSGVARTRSPAMSISIDLNQLEEEPAAESFSQERETSLTPSVQSEVLSQDPRLKQRDRSCHESASEPKLGSAPNAERAISTNARSQMADPETISISSSEDEMSDKGQPNTANELRSVQPANDAMQIDSGDSTRNNDKGTTQTNDPSPSPVHIHQHRIQRALSNHMAADLLKLKIKSIDLKFPKAIPGLETTQPQLPPARPPTVQWHAGALVPPDNEPNSSTSNCHPIQMSVSQEPNDSITNTNLSKTSQSGTFHTLQPKPPITASDPTGRPQVAIPRDGDDRTTFATPSKVLQTFRALTSKPPVTAPTSGSQSRAAGIPPGQVLSTQLGAGVFVPVNTGVNSLAPLVGQTQASKPQTLQVPTAHIPSVNTTVVKTSHLGTLHLIREQSSLRSPDKPPVKPLVRVPFPHNIQLQTGRPRFGQPPHEVPPYFLNRLRELTGSQDENPLISAFLTKGLYLCPWCQKKYHRAVNFTDHLVLNHSRSPDPKQGPIVSRAA